MTKEEIVELVGEEKYEDMIERVYEQPSENLTGYLNNIKMTKDQYLDCIAYTWYLLSEKSNIETIGDFVSALEAEERLTEKQKILIAWKGGGFVEIKRNNPLMEILGMLAQ